MQSAILQKFRKIVTFQFISNTANSVQFNRRSTSQLCGFDFIRLLITQIGSGREMNYSNLNATLYRKNMKNRFLNIFTTRKLTFARERRAHRGRN